MGELLGKRMFAKRLCNHCCAVFLLYFLVNSYLQMNRKKSAVDLKYVYPVKSFINFKVKVSENLHLINKTVDYD